MEIKHNFVSPKSDGADTTQVQPSNWNEIHTITMEAPGVVGRSAAGAGAATELATVPVSLGGTGQSSLQSALNSLAGGVTANRVLRADGTNVVLAQVALTTDVTNTLPVANGGLGLSSVPAASVLVSSDTNTITAVTAGANQSVRRNASNTAWEAYTPSTSTGDTVLANNNAFTGANTFYNATGQTFGTASATNDGIILTGRAGGTSTYRVTLTPSILSASRTLTLPNATGNVVVDSVANVFTNSSGQTIVNSATNQDGLVLTGRAGGTSSYRITITPTTLSASRVATFPDATGMIVIDTAIQTLTNKTLTTPVLTNSDSGTASGRLGYNAASGLLNYGTGSLQKTVVSTDQTQTLTNKTIDAGVYTGVIDHSGSVRGNITGTPGNEISCQSGNYFTSTVNGSVSFTFSNVPSSRAYSFTLEVTHTSGTITWPTSVKWPGDSAPELTAGKTHLFVFVTDDGGARWRGASLINYVN